MVKLNLFHELPDEVRGGLQFHVYTGPSMNPTLREADVLEVEPYRDNQPVVGDVLVFRDPGDEQITVHRVLRLTVEGLRMQGDNNADEDSFIIKPERVVGRVTAALCGDTRRVIQNGAVGARLGRRRRHHRQLRQTLRRILLPFYRLIAMIPCWQWLLPQRRRARIVRFRRGDQVRDRLLLGKRVVGRFDPNAQEWHIRIPYHMFIPTRIYRHPHDN